MNISGKLSLASIGLTMTLISGSALATVQTVMGTNVFFQYDDAQMGLFGQPTVSGNSLFFTPSSFSAFSNNGQGLVQTNSTINVKIFAKPGFNMPGINVQESGDYYLLGNDAQVAVGGQIRAFSIADPLPASTHVSDVFTTTAPLTTHTTFPPVTTNWQADASVALPLVWSNGGVNLTIENLLLAYTTAQGSAAFIEKKFAGGAVVISVVPEVETWAMMLVGMGLVGLRLRRRVENAHAIRA
jgi:hypothetical protein